MALSDILRPRICELGKIKIGGLGEERTTRDGKKWRLPRKDDHFTITTLNRDQAGNLVEDSVLTEQLKSDYGDRDGFLRQIPVFVLSDDMEEIMQSSWVWYGGKRVFGRSDGQRVTWFGDPKTMKALASPHEEEWRQEFADLKDPKGNPLFKIHTMFNCVIATKTSKWGGVYKFRTTSRITSDQLYGSLIQLGQLTGGVIRGLPLMLVVRPLQVAPNGTPTTVYVVHVELRGQDLISVQNQALQLAQARVNQTKQITLINAEYKRLLKSPGFEDDETEIGDIADEFHPDTPTAADVVRDKLANGKPKTEAPPVQTKEPDAKEAEPAASVRTYTELRDETKAAISAALDNLGMDKDERAKFIHERTGRRNVDLLSQEQGEELLRFLSDQTKESEYA